MTKQEQIEEMAVIGCVRNPQAHTAEECAKCDFKQGQCNAYRHAEALYNAGYRKIDDFEAENKQLKTECALLDDELRIARQETIDVLNKLKAENEELSKVVSSKVYDLIDNAKEIADAREAWEQQAKIEVLNELKEKMFEREYMGVKYKERIFYESEINEMIAEVQNADKY